ncbi:hypothetical protein FGG08_006705 [Glutinoglossum americanum]|uniref:Exosome complex component N-terminal domain-containing protein n=1 Tax=Glutinoglossum americanum TaxID=1670608 RepID=A0A9P8I6U7_9PEZI|nr:hypothetical protein FGG08_006705 [Glutinoglossum americanum]
MAITITPPRPAAILDPSYPPEGEGDNDDDYFDPDGDLQMAGRPTKRAKTTSIVTPGETITEDPQWMRGHGTYNPPNNTKILATVAGTLTTTNKLLSIRPLRARYAPEIGDLVIGRITEVQTTRYLVSLSSPLLSPLPLSAINLPGNILRKRTATDSLNIRTYLSENDLVAAEVQTLHADGSAGLHTRSTRYGKLRNGVFLRVSGTQGGVARGRRQVFELGDGVDVYLGVNGFVFVAQRLHGRSASASAGSAVAEVAATTYSSQNSHIPPATRWEIARVAGVIRALIESGVRVDEEMVRRGYEVSLEEDMVGGDKEGVGYLGGEKGRRIVRRVVGG